MLPASISLLYLLPCANRIELDLIILYRQKHKLSLKVFPSQVDTGHWFLFAWERGRMKSYIKPELCETVHLDSISISLLASHLLRNQYQYQYQEWLISKPIPISILNESLFRNQYQYRYWVKVHFEINTNINIQNMPISNQYRYQYRYFRY